MKADVNKFGPTPGCIGCRNSIAGLPSHNHDERCRKRMEEKLRESDEGRQRMQRSDARIDKRLAEHIERKEEARKTKKLEVNLREARRPVSAKRKVRRDKNQAEKGKETSVKGRKMT